MARKRSKKRWMQGAVKRPGALTAKAKRAGMSISEYCAQSDLSTLSKQQCNFARTARKISRRRKRK